MINWHIRRASSIVNSGGVVAYPTEAVYGLGCCPWELQAVTRILALKRRHPDKGFIVVAADPAQLEPLVELDSIPLIDTVLASWPGPVTWVVPAKKQVPKWLRGSHDGIAVRVSAHPVIQCLCRKTGLLISTSANPEGYKPARTSARVRAYFGDRLDYIVAGTTGGQLQPTEIRDAQSGEIIRSGSQVS